MILADNPEEWEPMTPEQRAEHLRVWYQTALGEDRPAHKKCFLCGDSPSVVGRTSDGHLSYLCAKHFKSKQAPD
jgi:hypothetical protein